MCKGQDAVSLCPCPCPCGLQGPLSHAAPVPRLGELCCALLMEQAGIQGCGTIQGTNAAPSCPCQPRAVPTASAGEGAPIPQECSGCPQTQGVPLSAAAPRQDPLLGDGASPGVWSLQRQPVQVGRSCFASPLSPACWCQTQSPGLHRGGAGRAGGEARP